MLLDGDWERKNKDVRAIGEKNCQVCPQQKLLAIFAGDQIRRDRRIKSPSVSWALGGVDKIWIGPDWNGPHRNGPRASRTGSRIGSKKKF